MKGEHFLVFAGSNYYPYGGFDDLYKRCSSCAEAKAAILATKDTFDWVQIVDIDGFVLVWKGIKKTSYVEIDTEINQVINWEWTKVKTSV